MTSLFSITIILTVGRIRQAEHNALAYLYHATNGPSWTNNNGWDVGENGTDSKAPEHHLYEVGVGVGVGVGCEG